MNSYKLSIVVIGCLAVLIMGQEGGLSGGAGCSGGGVEAVTEEPEMECPATEDLVCPDCMNVCDPALECPVCEEPEVPPADDSIPECESGWVCKYKEYKDKARLKCWCGKDVSDRDSR